MSQAGYPVAVAVDDQVLRLLAQIGRSGTIGTIIPMDSNMSISVMYQETGVKQFSLERLQTIGFGLMRVCITALYSFSFSLD